MNLNRIALLILCAALMRCPLTAHLTVKEVSMPLAKEVFRLHVLANTDSDDDQALKLKVKSAIVDSLSPIMSKAPGKAEARKWISDHMEELQTVAAAVITAEGYDYPVTVACETVWFPDKIYGDMTFPHGYYDALRVCIGEAAGQNWWCVLYPPLCFIDLTHGVVPDESKEKLETVLDEDDYNSLFDTESRPRVRFRIIDWFIELFS